MKDRRRCGPKVVSSKSFVFLRWRKEFEVKNKIIHHSSDSQSVGQSKKRKERVERSRVANPLTYMACSTKCFSYRFWLNSPFCLFSGTYLRSLSIEDWWRQFSSMDKSVSGFICDEAPPLAHSTSVHFLPPGLTELVRGEEKDPFYSFQFPLNLHARGEESPKEFRSFRYWWSNWAPLTKKCQLNVIVFLR